MEYNIDYREQGKTALRTVLKQEQNIRIIEKYVFDTSSSEVKNEEDLEDTYRYYIYQVFGDIMNGVKLKVLLENIKVGNLGWNHEKFRVWQEGMNEQDNFIENPFEVEEGVLECRNMLENGKMCRSRRVFSYSIQDRSCDEGSSTIAQCTKCGNKWRERG